MKHSFILLLFLSLISISIPAISQIKTGAAIKLGYEDRILMLDNGQGNSYSSAWLTKSEFADICLDVTCKRLSIYTNVKTCFRSENIYRYNPRQVEYKLGVSYKLKRISFNFEHLCSHSILDKATLTHEYFYEAYDRVFVEIILWGNKK